MDHFCHNHPAVKASKRCTSCKKYLCSDCAIPFLDRYSWSWSRLSKALRSSTPALFKKSKAEKSVFQKHAGFNMALFWGIGLLLLIAGAFLVGSLNLYHDIQESRRLELARKSIESYSPTDIEGTISEQPDAMILSNNIQIAGEAADSVIISLKVNGKIIAVTLPQDGRFAFNDISLGIGANEIVVDRKSVV